MSTTGKPADRDIDTVLTETRRFPPPDDVALHANAGPDVYERDFEEFRDSAARAHVSWFRDFGSLYEWDWPYARRYIGGTLNVCYDWVDRHVESGCGSKVAYYWEGEQDGDRRALRRDTEPSPAELMERVRASRALPVAAESSAPAASQRAEVPAERCEDCGYLATAPGHKIQCDEEAEP